MNSDCKIKISLSQMNVMLLAVEHGYKECEKGHSLEKAMVTIFDIYEVERKKNVRDA